MSPALPSHPRACHVHDKHSHLCHVQLAPLVRLCPTCPLVPHTLSTTHSPFPTFYLTSRNLFLPTLSTLLTLPTLPTRPTSSSNKIQTIQTPIPRGARIRHIPRHSRRLRPGSTSFYRHSRSSGSDSRKSPPSSRTRRYGRYERSARE